MRTFLLMVLCTIAINIFPCSSFSANPVPQVSIAEKRTTSPQNGQNGVHAQRGYRKGVPQQNAPTDANETTIEVSIQDPQLNGENKMATSESSVNKHAFRSFLIYCVLAALLIGTVLGLTHVSPKYIDDFLGYNGLRYVALVLILTAVALFGLMHIIEGKDVTVLLSAIAGYILGADSGGMCKRHSYGNDRNPVPEQDSTPTPNTCLTAPTPPTPAG